MKKGRRSREEIERDLKKLQKYLAVKKGRTLKEICGKFEIAISTAHRWMAEIDSDWGKVSRVGRDRPARYKTG